MNVIHNQSRARKARVPSSDRYMAAILVPFFLPIWVYNCAAALISGRLITTVNAYHDECGRRLDIRRFTCGFACFSLSLIDICRGRLALVGVSLGRTRWGKAHSETIRFNSLPPALFSLADVYKRIGLSDRSNEQLLETQLSLTNFQRLKVLFKGVFNRLVYPVGERESPGRFLLFGIRLSNVTMNDAIEWVCKKRATNERDLGYFANVNSFNLAADQPEFKATLNQADRVFADGSGARLAALHAGYVLKANVNGTDMLPLLCERMAERGLKLFLLGARPGVAQTAAQRLQARFSALNIVGIEHGYFDPSETCEVIRRINQSRCDVLLVAMGSPMQETWLEQHSSALSVPCALAVGGLFDFYADRVSRAPRLLREVGFEWVWRLLQEPSRMWRRYLLGNPRFLWRTYFHPKELKL